MPGGHAASERKPDVSLSPRLESMGTPEYSEIRQTRAQAANAAAMAKAAAKEAEKIAKQLAMEQQVRDRFQEDKEKMEEVACGCCKFIFSSE